MDMENCPISNLMIFSCQRYSRIVPIGKRIEDRGVRMGTGNILVLHVNGLHLGYLGCYGNDWVETPNLDRLAAEGIVFDQHIADCPKMSRHGVAGRYSFPSPEMQETR